MRVELGNVSIGYDDSGREEGPPLLLVHGFPLDRRMWQPLRDRLSRRCRIVTFDVRGLGESTGDGLIDDFADDAARLLTHLGIARAFVGGISMGGYVALSFARRHPDRLAGLVLLDTHSRADSEAKKPARDAAIARVAREGVIAYAEEFMATLVAPEHRAARDLAVAIAQSQSPAGVASALAALRDRPDNTPVLAGIRVPTLVVVGALDPLITPADARAFAAQIQGARFVEIEGAGHFPPLEAPDATAAAIEDLLRAAG